MGTDANKAVVRRYYEMWSPEVAAECFAPRFIEHRSGDAAGTPSDIERLNSRQEAIRTAFPDWQHTIEDMLAEGDRVMVRLSVSGTHLGVADGQPYGGALDGVPPTGRRVAIESIHVYRLAGGRIVEHWSVRDDLSLLRQLGLFPASGAAPASDDRGDRQTPC